jgi:hypothetical protein
MVEIKNLSRIMCPLILTLGLYVEHSFENNAQVINFN